MIVVIVMIRPLLVYHDCTSSLNAAKVIIIVTVILIMTMIIMIDIMMKRDQFFEGRSKVLHHRVRLSFALLRKVCLQHFF